MPLWLAVPAGHDGAVRGAKWKIDPFSRLVLSAHEGLSRAWALTSDCVTLSIRHDGYYRTTGKSGRVGRCVRDRAGFGSSLGSCVRNIKKITG
jgi:hypothetical protein